MIDRARILRFYYLATPLFAALDLLVGVSMRAAGVGSPVWRAVYYVFAFGCWFLLRTRPKWTPLIGLGESSVNLLLLILSILGPIFAAPILIAEGGDPQVAFGVGRMLNVLFAGSILILSFHGHQADLARRLGLPGVETDGREQSES